MRAPIRGMAPGFEVTTRMGAEAMLRRAPACRPTLRVRSSTPVTAYAQELCKRRWRPRARLWASLEDCVLTVAPPRRGKSAQEGNAVIDAPGAVVATSTRVDVFTNTAALREQVGPVVVCNPDDLGHVPSTLHWLPERGCSDPMTASLRAGYLLSGSTGARGVEDRGFWTGTAHTVLSSLLAAADLDGRDMRSVQRWALDWSDDTPVTILSQRGRHALPGWAGVLRMAYDLPTKTRQGVIAALEPALAFMRSPQLAAMALPDPNGGPEFDVASFVASRGTLYLLGAAREYGGVGPFFNALTGALFETGKLLASRNLGGRLDPPMLFALDEAALICPVPLERWTAEAGGAGMPVRMSVQSLDQLFDVWGDNAAWTILTNAAVKVIHGGGFNTDHLERLSTLCGTRKHREKSRTKGHDGNWSTQVSVVDVPVLPADRLRELPMWRVLVIAGDGRPTFGTVRRVWNRRDLRDARAHERRDAVYAAAANAAYSGHGDSPRGS